MSNEIEAAEMRIIQEEFTLYLKRCMARGLHPGLTARLTLGACTKVIEVHGLAPWLAGNRQAAKREVHEQIAEIGHDDGPVH